MTMGEGLGRTGRRAAFVLLAMVAAVVVFSGAATALGKVCPSGTNVLNPCSGTPDNDLLIGTGGADYVVGHAGADKISGGTDNDTTDGGEGNDTYSYANGWGFDTLIDASGNDHLNFSAVGSDVGASTGGVNAFLTPELQNNYANGPLVGERVNLSSGTVVEKVTGSKKFDQIWTGGAANTLQPGAGIGGALLKDVGGYSDSTASVPASSDTYRGFARAGYGIVEVRDHGGAADRLVFPFASTDVYFEAHDTDNDGTADKLFMLTSSTDAVVIFGQLEPFHEQKGHIEELQFKDETLTIGSETPQAQSLSANRAASAEAQVAALNEGSDLDAAEKERLSRAAKKLSEEAKKKERR